MFTSPASYIIHNSIQPLRGLSHSVKVGLFQKSMNRFIRTELNDQCSAPSISFVVITHIGSSPH